MKPVVSVLSGTWTSDPADRRRAAPISLRTMALSPDRNRRAGGHVRPTLDEILQETAQARQDETLKLDLSDVPKTAGARS